MLVILLVPCCYACHSVGAVHSQEGLVARDAYGAVLIIVGLVLCSVKTAVEEEEIEELLEAKRKRKGNMNDPLLVEES
jgi:hypothetical protein